MAIQIRLAQTPARFTSEFGAIPTSGIQPGDLVLVQTVFSIGTHPVIPLVGNLTLIDPAAQILVNGGLRLLAKRATNDEPPEYVFRSGSSTWSLGMLVLYSDSNDYLSLDALATQSNASSTTIDFPGVTTTVADTLLVNMASIGTTNQREVNAGSGMTERYPGAVARHVFCQTQAIASAGATGTRTAEFASGTAQVHQVVSFAIREQENPGEARVTKVGSYFEIAQDELRITKAGVYFELSALGGDVGIPIHLRAIPTSETTIYIEFDDSRVLPDATGYHWQVSPDGEAWSTLTNTAIGETGYHHHNLTPETTYYYRVQATPGGEWSNVAVATTPPARRPGGRGLWIDIENAAGVKQGEGPLLEVTRARITTRLDRAGDFEVELPMAYRRGAEATTSRYVRIHARVGGQAEPVFYGPIEQIGRRMDASQEMRTVGGANIARELTHVQVWAKDGSLSAPFEESTEAPTYQIFYEYDRTPHRNLVTAFAPAGWTMDGPDLAVDWSGDFYYDTVLDALRRVGEETGEHFRVGLNREVEWLGPLQPDAPASGVRAIHGVTLNDSFAHDEICLVTHVEEIQDAWDQVTRVHVSGGDYLGHPLTPFEATRAPHGRDLRYNPRRHMKAPITHIQGDGTKITLTLADDETPAGGYYIVKYGPTDTLINMTATEPGKLEYFDTRIIDIENPPGGDWIWWDQSSTGGFEARRDFWQFVDWATGTDIYQINNPFFSGTPFEEGYDEYAVYLVNRTVEDSLGIRKEAHVSFPHIVPTGVSMQAEVLAANQLLAAAFNWLRTRVRPERFYRVTVTGLERLLKPGETIRLSVHRFFDGVQFFNIEADLLILEASYDFDQTGIAQASLTVGTTDRYPGSDVETITELEERVESRRGGGLTTLSGQGDVGFTKPVLHDSEGDRGALLIWRPITGWDAVETLRYRVELDIDHNDPVVVMPDGAVDAGLVVSAYVVSSVGNSWYPWNTIPLSGSDALYTDGTNVLTMSVTAAGSIVLQRTAGAAVFAKVKLFAWFE